MEVYITYDRYEHDEWYDISWIGINKEQAIKQFKEQELPSFLEYGPDDCHSFQLVEVVMSTNSKEYDQKSVATKRFLINLEKQRTKDGIIFLVYNSKLNGDGCGVV